MKYLLILWISLIWIDFVFAQEDSISSRIYLPNGWSLTPLGRLYHWGTCH